MSLNGMQVAVVGGGMGGLGAALCFARAGAQVQVHERADAFADVGAGIQVSQNGLRVLDALGLGTAAREVGFASQGLTLNSAQGRRVAILPGGARETLLFHRADLIALLADAATAAGVQITFGAKVTPDAPPDADLIIAADGIRSAFRPHVTGQDRQATFTGQVAWRALVPAPQTVNAGGVNVYMGPGQHVVVYPLRGGRLLNIVAVDETETWVDEGWSQPADPADFQALFSGFGGPVGALLPHARDVQRWGIFAHRIPDQWSRGNVVLLGDAAHAMPPFLAQGAVMALEDAWQLAACLDGAPLANGLAEYQEIRSPRVARVLREAFGNARRFHLRNPVTRGVAHFGLSTLGRLAPGVLTGRFDWLYGYDITAK